LSQILNILPIVADFLVVEELVVLWWSKNVSMALATSSSSQARSPLSSQDVEEEEEEEDKEVAAASSSSLVHDDAIEVESSRSFLMALQELQSLRPQFYSTAKYCESSYLEKDQKDEMFDHLKKFSIKALVNAVDQLGNVVSKLNDLLAQQTTCVTAAELRTAALAQRFRSCQDHCNCEGLKQQSIVKSMPVNSRHHTLPDDTDPIVEAVKRASQRSSILLRETFDLNQPAQVTRTFLQPQTLPNQEDLIASSSEGTFTGHFAIEEINPPTIATGHSQSTSTDRQQLLPPGLGKVLKQTLSRGRNNTSINGTVSLHSSPHSQLLSKRLDHVAASASVLTPVKLNVSCLGMPSP